MRLLLLTAFIFCCAIPISAQGIIWITHCDNRNVCLNPNSCTQANIFIVPEAHEDCLNPGITLSYKVDLGNNNSVDLQAMDDTLNTTFPKGTHKVSWRATDQCGHLSNCTYLVTVEDCQSPQLLCISQLTQQIDQPDCSLIFTAQQFITAMSDNCSPNNLIDVGIRKKNSGSTGFPTTDTLYYGICDEGENLVEILIRDEAGFVSQCNTKVIVQDGNNDCDCNNDAEVQIAGCVKSSTNKRMSTYNILGNIESTAGVTPPININLAQSLSDSCFDKILATNLPFNASYKATVKLERNDDPLNGVSTFDLVLVSKHILLIEPFTSFYQVLAADVNKSGSVTTFDIVELRRLILGIYPNLPLSPSWRFIRPIPNPSNLNSFAAVRDTYQITLPNLTNDIDWSGLDFIGIKHGDINGSVTAFSDDSSDGSYLPPIGIKLSDEDWADAGDALRIPISMNDTLALLGWQLGLKVNPDLAIIHGVEGLPSENYSLKDGNLRALWFDAYKRRYDPSHPFIYLTIKVLKSGKISDMINLDTKILVSEVYTSDNVTRTLSMQPFKKVVLPTIGFHQSNQEVSALR